jgi:hypothetical protein
LAAPLRTILEVAMHPAVRSMQAFGVYAAATGAGLLIAPAMVLAPLGLAAPTEVWIRVLGALAVVLGSYYWTCGGAGDVTFMRASVTGRLVFAALCLALVVWVSAPPQLLVFGAVDLVAALWTLHGLRRAG